MKQELMEGLAAHVRACRKCGLSAHRRNPVVGEGSLDATVMFIGEAPGFWEDVKGRPFVGAAGKLLDRLISSAGLSRSKVYIGNILKCRPPENRDPRPDEVEACAHYLDRQIEIIRPKIIVTLGRHSTNYILFKAGLSVEGISKLHGRVYEANVLGLPVVIMPTYHPAAALYNVKFQGELERDFDVLRSEVEKLSLKKEA